MPDFLLVGLGNPGEKYNKTRHNLGFRVIDHLASAVSKDGTGSYKRVHRSLVDRVEIAEQEILLAKPLTYVNRSGSAVLSIITRHRIPRERILVVCDDISLALGAMRLRRKGSAGGHKGLQSIIDAIGSEFTRLRIGVGPAPVPAGWSDYVLDRFSAEEEAALPEIVAEAVREITRFINEHPAPTNNG